jgi:hypothetical protein
MPSREHGGKVSFRLVVGRFHAIICLWWYVPVAAAFQFKPGEAMSQPTPYAPSHSFMSDEAYASWFPGSEFDVELNNLKTTTDQVRGNLALIQRDDGALANGSVTFNSLSPALQTAGLSPLSTWASGVFYAAPRAVMFGTSLYQCAIGHTSGTFATDLAAGNWTLLANLALLSGTATVAANQVAAGPTSGGSAPPAFRSLVTSDLPTLPAPGATGLGGVQSVAAVTSKWLNAISNSGIPSLSQPAASDLSNGVIGSGAVVLAASPTLTGNVGIGGAASGRVLEVTVGTTASSTNEVSIQGYQAALEVFNQARTQNWYFGVNDADSNKLYIGGGYSPGQGLAPIIRLDTSNAMTVGNGTSGAAALTVQSLASVSAWAGGDQIMSIIRESVAGAVNELLVRLYHYSADQVPVPILALQAARGTVASPIVLHSGDLLAVYDGRGYDGGTGPLGFSDTAAQMQFKTTQAWTTSAHGSQINFSTTPNNSIAPAVIATMDQDGGFTVLPSLAPPAGGAAHKGMMFSSTANLGVFFGSGVPTLSAAQGSLYVRTDGSSTSTRLYVNTTGSTTWTNLVTAV